MHNMRFKSRLKLRIHYEPCVTLFQLDNQSSACLPHFGKDDRKCLLRKRKVSLWETFLGFITLVIEVDRPGECHVGNMHVRKW